MLNAIIVEDEKNSRELLKNLLGTYCPDVKLLHAAGSIDEALIWIKREKPDLLFLDIELQSGTSFDLLNQLEDKNFEVIFTTAFEQYAIKAIKFSSLDYLLKPIDPEELMAAVKKAVNKKSNQHNQNQLDVLLSNISKSNSEEAKICLSTADSLEFLQVKDILYCEANGSYTNFFVSHPGEKDRIIMVSKHLKEYENLLSAHPFLRVHNKFLVNLKAVQKYIKSDGGYILMTDEKQIPVSPNKKEEFFKRMAELS
jgi:two-component system LytT family response regulator